MDYKNLLRSAIIAAIKAADEILKIYDTDFYIETKSDNTPVTNADKAASNCIIQLLGHTKIPVLSEEGEHFSYSERKNWKHIWIVDPLDGTKEFIKRNGEFTVNIALVENNQSVIGVIYSPVFKFLYFAVKGMGSFRTSEHYIISEFEKSKFDIDQLLSASEKLPRMIYPSTYTIIASRSHLSKEVSARISNAKYKTGSVEVINTGSSIKFCRVAEGAAHEYPRYGNTMEWDTAAGQCIVEQSGGAVIDLSTGKPIAYNREQLLNNNFIVYGTETQHS
jgi:3'(2'), 5'-bisphosphate nucleotidase